MYRFIASTAFRSFSCKNWSNACSDNRSSLSVFWSSRSSFLNSFSNRCLSPPFTDKEYFAKWNKIFSMIIQLSFMFLADYKTTNVQDIYLKKKHLPWIFNKLPNWFCPCYIPSNACHLIRRISTCFLTFPRLNSTRRFVILVSISSTIPS